MKEFSNSGTVIQLQNFSINDGDGIRTTIFLMGCPLRCKWCSNPETWTTSPQVANYNNKEMVCPNNDYSTKLIDEETICPICNSTLYLKSSSTQKTLGKEMSLEEIIKKIKRQEIFYRFSGGGVTFSGGEPTCQISFLRSLAYELDKAGIDLAIETSGFFDYEETKDILEKLSHIFYDLKCMNDQIHQEMTGVSNKIILDNIIKIKELNIPITVRIPSIKEVNFTKENLEETLSFLKANFNNYPIEVEFLPYHKYGEEKYDALNIKGERLEFHAPSKEEILDIRNYFENSGIKTIEYK